MDKFPRNISELTKTIKFFSELSATEKARRTEGMIELQEEDHPYNHFSHPHPVSCRSSPLSGHITCSGCNLAIISGKYYYQCKTCPSIVHQVCCNLPRKTSHPGHFDHSLTLHVMPSSVQAAFNCKACEDSISTMHLQNVAFATTHCAWWCLSPWQSLPILTPSSEFTPPYDFQCDLCKEPCFNGWLYWCKICEFDTHLYCAISNQKQLLSQCSSASLMEENNPKIDYDTVENELMLLLLQNAAAGVNQSVSQDESLHSPTQDVKNDQTHEFFGSTLNPGEPKDDADKSSLLSPASYQYSDGCFSIDLAGSHSSFDHINRVARQGSPWNINVHPQVKEAIRAQNNAMLDRITRNLHETKQEFSHARRDFGFQENDPEFRLKEAFLARNSFGMGREMSQRDGKKTKESRRMSSSNRDSSNKSESARPSFYFPINVYIFDLSCIF